MAKKKRSVILRILRFTLRLILLMFLSSAVYLVVCKWLNPPITLTQLGGVFEGYGLHRDYVSWNDISRNVKLAAIASEDQLFPEHGGFDWKAISWKFGDGRSETRMRSWEIGDRSWEVGSNPDPDLTVGTPPGASHPVRSPVCRRSGTFDFGRWTLDFGLWTLDFGLSFPRAKGPEHL